MVFHLLGDRRQEERRPARREGRGGDRVPGLFRNHSFLSPLSAGYWCCVMTAAKRGPQSLLGTCSGCAMGHLEPGGVASAL